MTNTRPWPFLRAGLLVAAITLAGCTSATEEDATPTAPPPTDPPAATSEPPAASADDGSDDGSDAGEATSVFDLEVGDCFSADADQLLEVPVVDCAEPHEYEVFAVLEHDAADDAYPGDQEMLELAVEACTPPFEDFVAHDYQTSIWYITPLTPSTDTWAEGDREIVCTLNQQDDDLEPISVTGSAEGAAQ